MAGGWIRFRNYLRREEVGEEITLFMNGLMITLEKPMSATGLLSVSGDVAL